MSLDRRTDNLGYWCDGPVRQTPDDAAIIDLSGGCERVITYGRLDAELDRFAAWTRRVGLDAGDRLAIVVGNRYEFVVAMYGAMRAGVVAVPIATKIGPDILRYILKDAECRAAVVEPAANAFAVDACDEAGMAARVALGDVPAGWQSYGDAVTALNAAFEPPELSPDYPAFQPYTSGSTGFPKGVILTHAGQLWWIRALEKYWPRPKGDRVLAAVPLYHKNAMAGAIKPQLHTGGTVVLLPDFEPRRFLEVLSQYRCNHAGAVPTVFTKLLQQQDLIETLDFSALQTLSMGSAPVQEELLDAVRKAFGCPVSESYGLTEGGPVMIGKPIDGRPVPDGSCGVAWPEGEVKLVAADGTESQDLGELWVRNPGVTPGYHKLPDVNRKRLVDGWLATGDLFYRDPEGFFFFRGRVDDMFNSGGENIYPKEVENLLISHPDIYDACVVPVADPLKGEVPVAMVLRARGSTLSEDAVRRYALDNGPSYAHPRRVEIVDQMILNGAGKVDRKEITKRLTALFADVIAARREDRGQEKADA